MSIRPQSAQIQANKNQASANSNSNNQKGGNTIAITVNGQVSTGGASLKNGTTSASSRQKSQAQNLTIKRKKNQTPFSFYKDVCQKLNCNMNNAITHGLKGNDLIINMDNLTSSDVDPMRVLLRECDFSLITLTGNKEFNEEKFYQEHELISFNYRNQATINNSNGISKMGLSHQNNFGMSSNGFQGLDERGRTQDQGFSEGPQGLTPLGNHNGQKQKTGDASNKSQGNKDNVGGFKKLSNAGAEGNQNMKDGANKQKKQKKNFSSQVQSFNVLMHAVGQNIAKVQNSEIQLTIVKIINLNLKAESLSGICQGLQKSQTVKELYIQNCNLTSETIEKGMLPYIGETRSLNVLDLSFNKLDGQSGGLIGKLLSSHSKNRDEHIWSCGLRGEVPENNVNLEGICEVNLMGNLLTDSSIKDLCYFLQFDGWTRNINLRFNRIGADGLVELNKMLDNNENLISLDIRNNPGMAPNADDYAKYGQSIKFISKSIFNRLLNNIKVFKQKHDDMTRKQQEQIITNILYENNNQLPPNIFPQMQQDEAAIMMMALQNQQQQQQQLHPGLLPQQQNYLAWGPEQQQQLQQQQLQLQQQQQNQQQQLLQQQQQLLQQQQQQSEISYQKNQQRQNSQQIQPENLGQNPQMYVQQANLHQDQQYEHVENQEEDDDEHEYQEEDEKELEEVNRVVQQQQNQEELHDEGEGEEELTEEQLLLKEKQNFVFSEEFIEIQQQNFANEYGENEEFLSLPQDQQELVFQQYLAHHQEQYLLELENEEQMEGVQEVQEEQYEEDDEEDENQPHDNHFNEQQIYYQQNEASNQIHSGEVNHIESKNNNDQDKEHEDFNENEHEHDEEVTENNQNLDDFPQEIEEEEHDEEKIKQVMEQIYQNQQLEQIVDKNCKCCLQLQDKILQSEYEKLIILIKWNNCKVRLQQIEKQNASQKASLKQQIQQLQITASQQNQQLQQQQIANSWSAIQPNTMDQENNNLIMHPESFLLGGKPQQQLVMNANPQGNEQTEGEDNMLNRIEGLMTELTRLMDNLEIMQNNVTNNITCQLSNTTNTNNQTYHLLNSNPNINFNNTFTNILGGSHNNSNILPRNANSNFLNNLNQQTINQQQTSTFVPSQSSNNNTQIQQVSSVQSGSKKQKKNPQRQIVQQQYYQQQQQQQQQPQQLIYPQQQVQPQKYNGHNNSR